MPQHLGQLLPQLGHRAHAQADCRRQPDSARRRPFVLALSRADIVFTIGGLGPTEDDLTRDGIAAALDDEMVQDKELEAELRQIFVERKFKLGRFAVAPNVPADLRQSNSEPERHRTGTDM